MGALTTAYVAVLPDMKRFGPELRVGLRKVDVTSSGRDAGSRFSSGMTGTTKKAMGRSLATVGVAAGAAFAGALTKGFGRLSAIENAEAKLDGLGHSAKTVDTIMVNALASVKGTAFGLDEAATLAATAVASGIKPGKELRTTLGLVADAATIGGTSLAEMGGIFSDVAASNKVQGDTINQLNERGIPILKLLADVTGQSQAEVSALASKGKIDFATFQKAMEKGLGGAALKSGNTATGAFKNMGAAFSRVGAALLKGVFPQIGSGFGTITSALDAITPGALRFGEAFGTALTRIVTGFREFLPTLRPAAQFVTGTLLPAWAGWYKFLFSQLVPILKQVGGFIVTNIVPAFRVVARFIAAEVVPGFLSIVETVKALIRVVAPIISQIVGVIIAKFTEMRPQIQSIWGSVKEIITGVMFIIKEVVQAVTAIIKLIWDKRGKEIKAIVGAVFGAIFKIIGGVMKAIAGVIKLVVALIKGDWKGAWNAVKQIFSGVWQAIKAILSAAWVVIQTTFGRNISRIQTGWTGFWTRIKNGARGAMDWVHTKISGVLTKIKNAFSTAKTNISRIWDGVKAVVSAPIEWVKNNVYNRPLVPVWNRVAKLVGGTELKAYARGGIAEAERYANGGTPFGVRPGYTPGRDTHPILVGGGEAIMRPEWTRAAGAGYVHSANKAARHGGVAGAEAFIAQHGLPGFQTGGIVGWIKNTLGSAGSAVAGLAGKMKSWVLGGLRSAAAAVLSPLRGVIRSQLSGSGVKDTVGNLANKALDLILDKIKATDSAAMSAMGGGGGGPVGAGGYARALAFARAQNGKPYRYPMVGPRSYDCSGFISAIHNVILGRAPHSRRYATGTFLGGPRQRAGLTRDKVSPFRLGIIPTGENGGRIGHMAGTLNGVNVESRGGAGVVIGARARGWNNGLFKYHYGMARGGVVGDFAFDTLDRRGKNFDPGARALIDMLYDTRVYDRGGALPPGLSLALNKTGRSEVVRPGSTRPIVINVDLGDGVTQRVQGILDENDEFHASVGRMRR